MNKPIRTMSIVCMALFVALLVILTYLQYFQADETSTPQRQQAGTRRGVLPRAGAILVAGNSVAQSKPSNDQFEFQRVYSQPAKYAHLTGYYSYTYGRNAVELTLQTSSPAPTPRLFVTGSWTSSATASPRAATSR